MSLFVAKSPEPNPHCIAPEDFDFEVDLPDEAGDLEDELEIAYRALDALQSMLCCEHLTEGSVKVAILKRLCIPEYTEEGINDQMELAVRFLGDLQVLIDPCYRETASELIETIVHLLRFANPEVM